MIIVVLLFSDTIGVGVFVDDWILTHLDAYWWRRYLLVGWKVAIILAYGVVIVGLIHYKVDAPWKSPLKVEKEGDPSRQSARRKAFKKNLVTACLLALCFFATVLFVTFFTVWDGIKVFD